MIKSYIIPGISHAAGAFGIQLVVACILVTAGVPNFWWWSALPAAAFFTLREVWQWRSKSPPVWWQNRAPWDIGTAVVPVVAVALLLS